MFATDTVWKTIRKNKDIHKKKGIKNIFYGNTLAIINIVIFENKANLCCSLGKNRIVWNTGIVGVKKTTPAELMYNIIMPLIVFFIKSNYTQMKTKFKV